MSFPAATRRQKKFLKPIVAGLNGKEGDPSYTSVSDVPRILAEKYDIEVDFQIHPSSTLGTDLSQLDAVQTGFIDITSNVTTQFMRYNPAFAVLDLPYIVTGINMDVSPKHLSGSNKQQNSNKVLVSKSCLQLELAVTACSGTT